jgi:exonuclease SbcC
VIPLNLKISGFLSYRDPVELDFSGFHLACISGQNGAGKSSLLDAMTWSLFGQARKRDESLVNQQSKAAEVAFTFSYETAVYRVIRSLGRGKTTVLEFQIQQTDGDGWRPLTERSLRETQARIEQVLRLDYDTFVNVAFFLQGRADQFAQQPAARRKEILGNILGLEAWDQYRDRAAARRKEQEAKLTEKDGRLQEIEAELAEEPERQVRLSELEARLAELAGVRKLQESALANLKQARAALEVQRQLVDKLANSLERSRQSLSALQERLAGRQAERLTHQDLLGRAEQIESAYAAWQESRRALEGWEKTAGSFHEYETRRRPRLEAIASERARLEGERLALETQEAEWKRQAGSRPGLESQLETARANLAEVEARLAQQVEWQKQLQAGRERQSGLKVENLSLKTEMDELKARIDRLSQAEGAVCPLCGQALSPEHRRSTLEQLKAEGKTKGDAYRANTAAMKELAGQIAGLEQQVSGAGPAETDRLAASRNLAALTERLEALEKSAAEWKAGGAKQLTKLLQKLESEKYALEERKQLAKLDRELAALGYDAAAHDAARRGELERRPAEVESRQLESARAALRPIEDEIASLETQLGREQLTVESQEQEYVQASVALAAVEAQAPDLRGAERELFAVQERENQLNQEVGAARQKVSVLDDLRKRKAALQAERGELGLQIGRYRSLERAFGKDGVPALLIEQALPEIEQKANEILGRLSDDSMRIQFATQSKYKDEKRKDLRETLEIQVSDGAGLRDYELFSGGEAFRVNFAIRLALSEVLAQRKGARLQMLVVDEGFGSQDALGRQRLIQAINAVQGDFAKILVITHLEELKDAFPSRVEVEKTEMGSTVTVIN